VAEAHVRQGGNVGVALGYKNSDGWKVAALDVEESGVLPNPVKEWADIYGFATFESGHDGLNRLLKVTPEAYDLLAAAPTKVYLDGDEEGDHDLELLAPNGIHHAVIPPSTIKHQYCGESKSCDGTGTGSYHLHDAYPDAPKVGADAVEDLLEMLDLDPAEGSGKSDESATSTSRDDDELMDLPDDTEELIEEAEAKVRKFQTDPRTGGQAFEDLMDLLRGGTGGFDDLWKDDGLIDKSFADVSALRLTYGIMRENNTDNDHASDLTYALYDHYIDNHPYTKDGKERKWHKRGDRYQKTQLTAAIEGFDPNIWNRWSRAEKKNRRPTQNYSKLTKDTVRAVVDMMTADHPLSLEFYRDMYRIDIRPLRVPPRRLCTGRDPRARGLRGRRRADRAVP
jgi:hypothetical protein